jgi:hypothetical protein
MPSAAYYGMFPVTGVMGLEECTINLNRQLEKIRNGSQRGLIEASAYIRNDTEKTPYITPLDYGNLRSSWFVATPTGGRPPDKWNTGFKDAPKSVKKVKAARMLADHSAGKSEMDAKVKAATKRNFKVVIIGYTAYYAVYVHENYGAAFKRAQSGPGWFGDALKRNTSMIVYIVGKHSMIP